MTNAEKIEKEYKEKLLIAKQLDETEALMNSIGLKCNVSVFDSFITFKDITREDALELYELLDVQPLPIANNGKLSTGYGYGKNMSKMDMYYPMYLYYKSWKHTTSCEMKFNAMINDKVYSIHVDITEPKGNIDYVSELVHTGRCDCRKVLKSCSMNLHETISSNAFAKVQTWGSIEGSPYSYMVWFDLPWNSANDYDIDLKDVIMNA